MRGDRALKQRNLDHRKVFKGHASQRLSTAQLIGEASCFDSGDVHIQMNSIPKECAGNPSSRNIRSGVQSCTQERVHSRYRVTSTMKQGSLMILTRSLEITHTTGVALGIGLLTTFIHATKSILNQVFLRERCSEIQCAWLLVFIAGSSILSYYTFYSQLNFKSQFSSVNIYFVKRENCPLCRTVISDHINKWKDGITSSHFQIY
eukprot:bmy_10778T0